MRKTFAILIKIISAVAILVVKMYQILLSPILMNHCRYRPTCSQYMIEAIKIHGLYGLILGIKRIFRCHPYGGYGYDPVPEEKSSLTLKE